MSRNNHHYIAHKNKNELQFKCKVCNIDFEMKEELRIHSFIHFDGDIHTCLECHQIFKNARLLRIHMQKHEDKKKFLCKKCGDSFTFKTGLEKHIRLNRCKGPKHVEEANPEEIAKIAMEQLKMVTQNCKKWSKAREVDVMKGFKDQPESDYELEDDFDTFLPKIEPKTENVITEVKVMPQNVKREIVGTKQTRKVRHKIPIDSVISQRKGRPHLVYTCDFCGENIKFKTAFVQHLKQHTIYQRYKCQQCEFSYKSRSKLLEHSIEVHGEKLSVVKGTFVCEHCDKKFDTKSIFESHKLSHNENARNYMCETCNAAFKSVGNLRRHQQTHAPTRDFQCDDCSKSFKTPLALKIHSETVHAKYKIFVNCPICKAIVQEKLLKNHIHRQHTDAGKEKPFSCSVCLKSFRTARLEERHFLSVHEPKSIGKIYVCPQCPDLKFLRQRDLKEHSFVHFDGDIFQCDICQKLFKNKRLLRIHSECHSENAKMYPCKLCPDVVFRSRGGRQKHMQKHISQEIETAVEEDI